MTKAIYNSNNKDLARKLRKKQTLGEMKLWSKLRRKQFLGYKFKRQYPLSKYIVDFYCEKLNLVIEIDGRSHDDNKYDYDKNREKFIELLGNKVLRFSEYEIVNNINAVLLTMENFVNGYL